METTNKHADKTVPSTGMIRRQKALITAPSVLFIGGLIIPPLLSLKWGAVALWIGGPAFILLVILAFLRLNQAE